MKFDVVLTNPPFQDRERRGKTPHKLWIEFTVGSFRDLVADGGILCQVSPASFQSPSNRVLGIIRSNETEWIDLDHADSFPEVGSTFSSYLVRKVPDPGGDIPTTFFLAEGEFESGISEELFYLPSDLCEHSLSIHRKVVFSYPKKLVVEHDYVTCHNILLRKGTSLSREQTPEHSYPVFHTNRQTWWSSVRQEFADVPKVMWTRSGYTRPFFDPGRLGGTDMVYFVRVASQSEGQNLAHNMNLPLMQYIYSSAKWSGFGNEKVFASLPALPLDRKLGEDEMYEVFSLTSDEVDYVRRTLG